MRTNTPRAGGGRRAQILETFIRHVAERGYEQTNLGDIATELQLSKGTIVHHFHHKARMLAEFEESYLRRQLNTLQELWRQLPTPPERLASFIFASVLVQVIDPHATVATQREIAQLAGDPDLVGVRELRNEIQAMVRSEVRQGVDSGLFRPVDADLVTFQLFGASQWMWTWFERAGAKGPDDVGAAYVSVFLGGLLADRSNLSALTDPAGAIPRIVRATLGQESSRVGITVL